MPALSAKFLNFTYIQVAAVLLCSLFRVNFLNL